MYRLSVQCCLPNEDGPQYSAPHHPLLSVDDVGDLPPNFLTTTENILTAALSRFEKKKERKKAQATLIKLVKRMREYDVTKMNNVTFDSVVMAATVVNAAGYIRSSFTVY